MRPLQLGSPARDGEALSSCGSGEVDPTGRREEDKPYLKRSPPWSLHTDGAAQSLSSLGMGGRSGSGPQRTSLHSAAADESCPTLAERLLRRNRFTDGELDGLRE